MQMITRVTYFSIYKNRVTNLRQTYKEDEKVRQKQHPRTNSACRIRSGACLLTAALCLAAFTCGCSRSDPSPSSGQESSGGSKSSMSTQETQGSAQSTSASSQTGGTANTTAGKDPGGKPTTARTTAKGNPTSPAPSGQTETISIADYKDYGSDENMLSAALSDAVVKSAMSVTMGQPKTFRLLLEKNHTYKVGSTLNMTGAQNVEIDGNGSTIYWTQPVTAFYLSECQGVKFSNLSIDYDPLPYTQGVVESVSGNSVVLKVDEGYPSDPAFFRRDLGGDGLLWSNIHQRSDGGVLAGAPASIAFPTNSVEGMSGGRLKLTNTFLSAPGRSIQQGDLLSIFHRGATTVLTNECAGLVFTNVNIYSSPGFGVNEGSGDCGTVFRNCKIVPGPKPAGATQERIRSVNADGMHWGNVKKGPTLENCTITHGGDDGINIQGFFFHVLTVAGNKIVVSPKWDTPLKVGETIEGYDAQYNAIGTAKITAFRAYNDSSKVSQIEALYRDYDKATYDRSLLYEITLDKALNLSYGSHITSLDRIGSGAVVRNCTFGYNRARGIVVKGHDIVIENNKIIGSDLPAIVAHADILWCESGFPVNVTIRNNTIINNALSLDVTNSTNVDMLGSILVGVARPENSTGFFPCYGNKNIVIEGNTIQNTRVWGIFATNCDGITIRNNTISKPFSAGFGRMGELYNLTPQGAIFLGKSQNITVSGNKVTGAPAELIEAVTIDASCSNIKSNTGNSLSH